MKKQLTFFRHRLRQLVCCAVLILMIPLTVSTAAAESAASVPPSGQIGGEGSGLINILLVGQDRREENEPARADSIILCSFRPESKTITITSFLRDLYVQLPGQDGNRLNAAYAFGGMPMLKQTLQDNLGIYTDGCIDVDFSQFSGIIDTLGGVEMELRQDEAEAVNRTVPGDLEEGTHLLTGSQALAYSRIRNLDSDGDFSRTGRQRKLLSSLLDSYRDAGLLKILSAIADTLPLISTDLDKKEILFLAAKLFPLLEDPVVVSQRIPADGTYSYSTIRNMEVLTTDLDATKVQLYETLFPDDKNQS